MYWLLAVVAVSAYALYTKSLPLPPKPIQPLTGVACPSGGWNFTPPSMGDASYAVKPGTYQVSAQAASVTSRAAPPTRNGAPFSAAQ